MDLIKKGRSVSRSGYSLGALLAIYCLVMIKPAKPMAERSVICNGTIYYYNNHIGFVKSVKRMRNCTVLEGGIHISFLNMTKSSEMLEGNALFPRLREISGFLCLYNMEGVESVAHLFPKLSVIRGEPPLKNKDYHISLLIAFNRGLKRIGLNIAVLNGSVHIRDNRGLCPGYEIDALKNYSSSVDIDIRDNMPDIFKNSTIAPWWCRGNYSAPTWPSPPATPCHKLCLGGCTGPSPKDCYVCRTFQHLDTCVEECPPEKRLSLPTHHCINEEECKKREHLKIFPKLDPFEENARYLIRQNSCVPGCRKWFEPRYEYGFLKCRKSCSQPQISTLFELEKYRNCSYTLDPLRIAPLAHECEKYNVSAWESALERNLGAIKTITGGLHIKRLHGVQNLHFLKNLERIITTNETRFSLLIDDNASLNQLFSSDVAKRLKIKPAKNNSVMISNNPMLCSQEISPIKKVISWEVININNGKRGQCNDTSSVVETKIYNITATSAVVEWEPTVIPIQYSTIYFRQAPPNVTFSMLAMNFPSSEHWESVDRLGNFSDNGPFLLNRLNSSSRYAIYIEAVGETTVLRSEITYFWTESLRSRPCSVTAWPYPTIFSSEPALKIEWAVPTRITPKNVEYLITGKYIEDAGQTCSSKQFRQINISDYTTVLNQLKSWECPISDRRQIIESCNPNDFSTFLDTLLEKLESGIPSNRFPKDLNPSITPHVQQSKIITKNKTDTGDSTGRLVSFVVQTRNEAVVVNNLVPFGSYRIRVYACSVQHGTLQNASWESRCGLPGYGAGRSSALEGADTLLLSPFATPSNYSSTFVLQWEKGKVTNSLTWYTVRITDENKTQETLCSDKDEIKFEAKSDGLYNICVTVESLVRSGETRCIFYRVAASMRFSQPLSHPWKTFFSILVGVVSMITVIGFLIWRIRRPRPEDQIVLLGEEAFETDIRFSEISVDDMENVLF